MTPPAGRPPRCAAAGHRARAWGDPRAERHALPRGACLQRRAESSGARLIPSHPVSSRRGISSRCIVLYITTTATRRRRRALVREGKTSILGGTLEGGTTATRQSISWSDDILVARVRAARALSLAPSPHGGTNLPLGVPLSPRCSLLTPSEPPAFWHEQSLLLALHEVRAG